MRFFKLKILSIFSAVLVASIPITLSHAQEDSALKVSVGAVKSPEATKSNDDTYIIGPSDIIEIQVWKEPELSRVVPVRPDGMITVPLINDVKAAGLTPLELKKNIEEKIKDFVEAPEVSVLVRENSSQRIYVIGKVQRPGEYRLTKDLTVLQALSLVGGLSEWADSDDIVILRRVGGKEERIPFDYKKVISGRKVEQNIYLQPNDTIIVP